MSNATCAAAYVHVSASEPLDPVTFNLQLDRLFEHAHRHQYTLDHLYVDVTPNSTAPWHSLERLQDDARRNVFAAVIVLQLSRAAYDQARIGRAIVVLEHDLGLPVYRVYPPVIEEGRAL